MKGKFMSGMMAGSIIGATAGMYAFNKMSPRQRKKAMKTSKKMLSNVVSNMGMGMF
ncbi:YtxH domain-containing protein [Sporosalibacterium faouarense]|uniref:YtxH domain-containing protein n=1 Tax=Sporosalibacterium faouarense TaxID=516123 RepID=UPI00141CF622|nr:YtxH domain-containing protein [Sporosalibacterium faouarense]MTI48975.1 YtxH domain-containing protein [Bacillota bacterium]